MSVEPTAVDGRSDGETMAALDEIDGRTHVVIADVAREDAWVAVVEGAAVEPDR